MAPTLSSILRALSLAGALAACGSEGDSPSSSGGAGSDAGAAGQGGAGGQGGAQGGSNPGGAGQAGAGAGGAGSAGAGAGSAGQGGVGGGGQGGAGQGGAGAGGAGAGSGGGPVAGGAGQAGAGAGGGAGGVPEPASVCGGATSGKTITVAKSGGDFGTIQEGLDEAGPGDVVWVKAGVYGEEVVFHKSGSASEGCIVLKGEPGAILDGGGSAEVGVWIDGQHHVAVVGLTVQQYGGGGTPTGIRVEGSAHHVEVRQNVIHHIESDSDAHGISFYGTSGTPMSDLLIDQNEIRDCKLGSSESLVLNGNVTRFVVSRNKVHDNDNIGIDFIGFEGVGPSGQDQARDGVCVDNEVYNISSAQNPAYGGERAADGIYVDGGKDIVIERNRVASSDIGIELASEHQGKTTGGITVRNNFVSGSYQGNIMVGGYDADRGNAADIVVVNNTLHGATGGEIILQFNTTKARIENNLCVGKAGQPYVQQWGSNNSQISVDNNLYFGASASDVGDFSDAHALFADPMLAGAPGDLHLMPGSPAIDAGKSLGSDAQGAPLGGAFDIDGQARAQGPAIDIGAHER